MRYEHTTDEERRAVMVGPGAVRLGTAGRPIDDEITEVEMELRGLETAHAFTKSMIDAGDLNTDPSKGPCVVGPPAWADRNKPVEQRAREQLTNLDREWSAKAERHRQLKEAKARGASIAP